MYRDYTGQHIGNVTVLRKVESKTIKRGTRLSVWEVQCDCGKLFTADSGRLYRKTINCGCRRKHDLTGQKFGKLRVIKEIGLRPQGHKANKKRTENNYYWECLCDCGNPVEVNGEYLKEGSTRSCGCLKKIFSNADRTGAPIHLKTYLRKVKKSAKERGLNFDEDVDISFVMQLFVKQNNKCALSGIPIDLCNCSLDRIDSNRGYSRDNVQWVLIRINFMKQKLTNEEFIDLCKHVVIFHDAM